MSGDRSKRMPPSEGVGMSAATEWEKLARETLALVDRMKPVYDAAMELYELEFSHASSDGAEWNVATANAYAGLLSACRRAKEGE